VDLLGSTNGLFQHAAQSGVTNEIIASGWLLLGDAHLRLNYFEGAETALRALNGATLAPELDWRRQYLQCRLLRAQGRLDEALQDSTNLLASANVTNRAAGVVFKAGVLEELKRIDDAIAAYGQNLAPNIPAEQQAHALLRIADLSLNENKAAEAVQTLEKFWNEFPRSGAADVAFLTLGELQLKQYLAELETNGVGNAASMTNLLPSAIARFDLLLNTFTNPASARLAGKALLEKGWCLWLDNRFEPAEDAFRLASERLPFSEDQAVARFKWADTQFVLKDFPGAISNYNFLVDQFASFPEVKTNLLERALYQTVRAALEGNDLPAATNALQKILDWYPNGFAGHRSLLLTGEGLSAWKDTARARELFDDFEKRFPDSPLLPQVRLAVARSYEQDGDWEAAITNYAAWMAAFTNHADRAQAEYGRAWDTFMAGRQTNALTLFTNFVAEFPRNELAARAQFWIGGFYFERGEFLSAENNFQLVYQQWPNSELADEAYMMAGRAAIGRLSYKDAIFYFTNLTLNPECPPELKLQATFAYADSLVRRDYTNKTADLNEAIGVFKTILQSGTNHDTAPALGRIGECYLQMAAADPAKYDDAIGYYQQVLASPPADLAARSLAKFDLGVVAEKQAEQKTGADQTALLRQALDDYLDVFYDQDLRESKKNTALYWTERAGWEAGRMIERLAQADFEAGRAAEALREWNQAAEVYEKLGQWFPPLRMTADAKIGKLREKIRKAQPADAQEKS